MNTKGEQAQALFEEGYNCAQAVFLAFAEEQGLDRPTAARLVSGMGGGIGRLRETCGAVSSMVLAAGLLLGYDDPRDSEAKAALYAQIQTLANRFREKHGSLICRELLGPELAGQGSVPDARTPQYYQARPCGRFCASAAGILEEFLKEQEQTDPREKR